MTLANNLHIQLNGQLQKINEGNDRAESKRGTGSDVKKIIEFERKKNPQVQLDEIEINLIDDDDSDGNDDNDDYGSCEGQVLFAQENQAKKSVIQSIDDDVSDRRDEHYERITRMMTEYEERVSDLVVRTEDGWMCRECSYVRKKKHHTRDHVEMHITGFSLECKYCDKSFKRRNSLRLHKNCHKTEPGKAGKPKGLSQSWKKFQDLLLCLANT